MIRTGRQSSKWLGAATAALFAACATRFGYTAFQLLWPASADHDESARQLFSGAAAALLQALVAAVALLYLAGAMVSRNFAPLWSGTERLHRASSEAGEVLIDRLTGVPNRTAYTRYAESLADDERWMIVLFVDLGGLKEFNDEYGRDAGDRLLRDMAQRLAGSLGSSEKLFHLGGDEFAIVGLGHDTAQAAGLYTRTEALLARPIGTRSGETVVVSSLGVATGHANVGVDGLLRRADASVYRTKSLRRQPPGVPSQR
ncbi:GGDEF domain-containing protein [Planctomonas psychrotolerans]|uniref:GGDEF domain-containing protein n=1 Tax=Planctomonas psychrotolerans TaxID=2528712 RepID=UPI001D0D41BF|nr:GGDEF domain-containing protein [Planctomonas psychrotolerans]